MGQLKEKIPAIVLSVELVKSLIKPIADALIDSGGLGFRKRVKAFAEETKRGFTEVADLMQAQAESTEADLSKLEERLEIMQGQIDALRNSQQRHDH
jgi:hypothetical protein